MKTNLWERINRVRNNINNDCENDCFQPIINKPYSIANERTNDEMNANRSNATTNPCSASIGVPSLASTPIGKAVSNRRKTIDLEAIDDYNDEMSPVVRTRKKCKRAVIEDSDDETIDVKTSLDFYLNHPLLKAERSLSDAEVNQLKQLNYEIMTQICDNIGSNTELLDNDIDLKELYDTHRELVVKMSGVEKNPSITVEKPSTCRSPELLKSFDEEFSDTSYDLDDDICIIEDEVNDRKTVEKPVVDLCDEDSGPQHKSSDCHVINGDTTPSVCLSDGDSDAKDKRVISNDDDIAIISELLLEEWNYEEEEELEAQKNNANDFNNCYNNANDFNNCYNNANDFNNCDLDDSMNKSDPFNNYKGKVIEVEKSLFNRNSRSSLNNSFNSKFVGYSKNDGTDQNLRRENFDHSEKLRTTFKNFFGLTKFRTNQLEAINAALTNNDCFILMPTGGGKSLCYQLPALMTDGVSIVISPLRSLIQDQVQKMSMKCEDIAQALTSDVTQTVVKAIYSDLNKKEPDIKILFVTPEKISASNTLISIFNTLYERGLLSRFVIDEAHCVSQWGHDFRPDYKKLSVLREQFPKVPIMALTATATPRVRIDILHQLGITDSAKWFMQSFNRSNLKFEVRQKSKGSLSEIVLMLQTDFRGKSGIIYCLSKRDCDQMAQDLCDNHKIKAVAYHAGLTDKQRKNTQDDWTNNKVYVICATIAFGMGIDKPDVRFVIHNSLPKSIEGYYQESGRAGRDGQLSHCILYYKRGDVFRWKNLLQLGNTGTNATLKVAEDNLNHIDYYCNNKAECRRVQLLQYFGEVFNKSECIDNLKSACDNCLSKEEYENRDITEDVKVILQCVQDLIGGVHQKSRKSNWTLLHFISVFKGGKTKNITDVRHDQLSMHAKGQAYDRNDIHRLFVKLVCDNYLSEDAVIVHRSAVTVSYVRLGSNAEEILRKGKRFSFPLLRKIDQRAIGRNVLPTEDKELSQLKDECYEALKEVCQQIASEKGIQWWNVIASETLTTMAARLPTTENDMISISGVTNMFYEKFGQRFLLVTQKYFKLKAEIETKNLQKQATSVYDDLLNCASTSTSTASSYQSSVKRNYNGYARKTGTTKTAKSPYFTGTKSKPASNYGFNTNGFISVPKRRPKVPPL